MSFSVLFVSTVMHNCIIVSIQHSLREKIIMDWAVNNPSIASQKRNNIIIIKVHTQVKSCHVYSLYSIYCIYGTHVFNNIVNIFK